MKSFMERLFDFGVAILIFIAIFMLLVSFTQAQHISINEVVGGTEYTLFVPDTLTCNEKQEIIRELRTLVWEMQAEMCRINIRNNPNVLPFISNGISGR